MSKFEAVLEAARIDCVAQEIKYAQWRETRWQELVELAHEADLRSDGRKNKCYESDLEMSKFRSEIDRLAAAGVTRAQIADQLGIDPRKLESYIKRNKIVTKYSKNVSKK